MNQLAEAAGHPAVYVVLATIAGLVRLWIRHRTVVRREEEVTRRLEVAVRDTGSTERAAVVRALR
ncbi:hypothetical protein GCM10022243_09050 [Saccharothrix violaceirubra]|uniref:Uncharacterized protein n=1 Tax=Saccharothrix violaceirubra TaxID=413306 RepID=A0A7W7WX53_9PSEU|nr:hypothetical protein [Saccharothrix violaceirubra]MBB4966258.1 hypothetical protein [Saccharothrix violaceirubra]